MRAALCAVLALSAGTALGAGDANRGAQLFNQCEISGFITSGCP